MLDLERSYHGGECCGITHLYGFPYKGESSFTEDDYSIIMSVVRRIYNAEYNKSGQSILIECVLTDNQPLEYHQALLDIGFETINWFVNRNSGNTCTIYHFSQDPENSKTLIPRTREDALAAANRVALNESDISKG